jgi:hypothetical protein
MVESEYLTRVECLKAENAFEVYKYSGLINFEGENPQKKK